MSFCNVSNHNGIFTLTLASGDGHNYLTAGAITELKKALESVRSSPARGLVTTSRSGSFCDGVDYGSQSKESAALLERRMAEVVRLLLDLPVPTAAAVCGDATSLGFALALAHDHCVVYKEAVLGFPEARLRRRVPDYAVALVREKIANLRLRKLLVLKSQTCTGEELAGTWYSAQGAAGYRDQVVTDAVNLLEGVVVGDGADYAKARRTVYTHSCAAVSVTTSTTKPPSDESSRIYQSSATPILDIKLHIIESITNGFSDEQKVGSGGYGNVYKGVYEKKEIAVKMLHQMPDLDENQFRNELMCLKSVQHPNIVRLVGYCYEIRHKDVEHNGSFDFSKHIYRVLCFEYLPGGSLDKHLFEESCGHDWCTRYKIIKGICQGLNYLHAREKPIFHLDLKPGNVLLDNSMVPKIADFGLSRLFAGTLTHVTQKRIGTLEYMPPEYRNRGIVSNKYDVFSLGVMVIQIMTGPLGYSKFDELQPEEFTNLVHDNWNKRLQAMPTYTPRDIDILGVKRCLEIALRCVQTEPVKRPTILEIVDALSKLDAEIEQMSINDPESLKGQKSSDSKDLGVDPALELRFPFEVKRDISCCLQLTNRTDHFVAFYTKTNEKKYCAQPNKGTVPPWSKCYIVVTMRAQEKAPPNMQCDDMFFVQSARVSEDLASDDITGDLFKRTTGKEVDQEKLPIVYVALPQPPHMGAGQRHFIV